MWNLVRSYLASSFTLLVLGGATAAAFPSAILDDQGTEDLRYSTVATMDLIQVPEVVSTCHEVCLPLTVGARVLRSSVYRLEPSLPAWPRCCAYVATTNHVGPADGATWVRPASVGSWVEL